MLGSLDGVDEGRVCVRGSSLGGFVAIHAAAVEPGIAAVIAICPAGERMLLDGIRRGRLEMRADTEALVPWLEEHDLRDAVELMGEQAADPAARPRRRGVPGELVGGALRARDRPAQADHRAGRTPPLGPARCRAAGSRAALDRARPRAFLRRSSAAAGRAAEGPADGAQGAVHRVARGRARSDRAVDHAVRGVADAGLIERPAGRLVGRVDDPVGGVADGLRVDRRVTDLDTGGGVAATAAAALRGRVVAARALRRRARAGVARRRRRASSRSGRRTGPPSWPCSAGAASSPARRSCGRPPRRTPRRRRRGAPARRRIERPLGSRSDPVGAEPEARKRQAVERAQPDEQHEADDRRRDQAAPEAAP